MKEPLEIYKLNYNTVADRIDGTNRSREVYYRWFTYVPARSFEEAKKAFEKIKKKEESNYGVYPHFTFTYSLQGPYLVKGRDFENPTVELVGIHSPVMVDGHKVRLEKLVSK